MRPNPAGLSLTPTLVAALALALPAVAQSQTTKKAAAPDTRPLARFVPRDNLVLYAGSEGLDIQSEAWKKTAAYKLLNESSLGLMLEDITAQLSDRALGMLPEHKLTGADVLTIVKHMAKSGFVVAHAAPEARPGMPAELGMMVVRGVGNKSVSGSFGRLLATMMGASKRKTISKSGRVVVVVDVPAGKIAKEAISWSWWMEKDVDLVVVMGKGNDDEVIAVIDAKDPKKPSALAHPVRAELAKPEGGFTPLGQFFFDPLVVPKSADPAAAASRVTGSGLTRLDFRWGFQDDALMTITRLKAASPRRGVLALFDQVAFDKGKLPPLPEGIESFTVVSLNPDKAYENLLAGASTPEARARLTSAADALKSKSRIDLRRDLLAHLGSKFAFYAMPGAAPAPAAAPPATSATPGFTPLPATAAAGSVPGNPLGGVLGMTQIPRFTLAAEVDDNAAFIKTLDNLMVGFNKEVRERANEAAESAAAAAAPAPGAAKSAQPKSHTAQPAPEFKLTPSSNPAERSYVLNIPPSQARQFPPGFRPTIRLLKKQLVMSTTPDSARQALEVKPGEWVPPADLAPAFDQLPKELIILGARDPRTTLPENLASLPATIQRVVNSVLALRQAGDEAAAANSGPGAAPAPAPGGAAAAAPMLVFNIPVTRLPKPEELRERLFPGSFAVAADDQEIRIFTRSAFPGVIAPSTATGLVAAMTAARAASKAQAEAAAAAAAAADSAKPVKPSTTTKSATKRIIPKD